METEPEESNNTSAVIVTGSSGDVDVEEDKDNKKGAPNMTGESKVERTTDDGSDSENYPVEDDLEEGELKDDDGDDDDDEFTSYPVKENECKSNKSSSKTRSDDESPSRPSSSSSSSSKSSSSPPKPTASEEKSLPPPSSKSSSRNGSHYEPYIKSNLSYNQDYRIRSRHSLIDKYRIGREKEDPSEKAAKLISMRTKLLEARSREIEMKFQKNKIRLMSPPPPRLTLETPKNVKMTITLPSISYNENPNPPPKAPVPIDIAPEPARKSKSRRDEKEKTKSKKSKKKKKKKKSSKKHKKSKSSSSSKKASQETKTTVSPKTEPPLYDNTDHVGPKTPPDNQVLNLNDEQVEWPSHLIKMTLTLPSISYSVNPNIEKGKNDNEEKAAALLKRRRSTTSSLTDIKKLRIEEKSASFSSSPSQKAVSPILVPPKVDAKIDENNSLKKYQPSKTYELDLNQDYSWYYNYFINSFEMDPKQAQHQALSAVVSGSYNPEVLEKWLNGKGLSKRSSKDPDIRKQLYQSISKDPLRSCSDPSRYPESTVDGSARTIVTRISRNLFNKEYHDQPFKLEDQLKGKFTDKQETNSYMMELAERIKNRTAHESSSRKENEDKGREAYDVKEDKNHKKELCSLDEDDFTRCISLHPIKPHITIIKSQKEVILPNGQTLPAGTIQRIVHPYPRVDSEMLGPCFDLY